LKKLVILFTVLLVNLSFAQKLTIAAAANVQYALDELVNSFKKDYPGLKINKIISSSGKLTSQIVRGAPYDIFLSADMKYPWFVYKKGYAVTEPKVYAYGVLVLWSMKNIPLKKRGIAILLDKHIKRIAVPNPKNAPYGREAIRVLKHYKIYERIKSKIVYGESVSQTNQYIYRKLADIGFTSKSTVVSPKLRNRGKWIEIDKKVYNPIEQGVVLLKQGKNNEYAKKFYDFIFTQKARLILKKYGYLIPDNE